VTAERFHSVRPHAPLGRLPIGIRSTRILLCHRRNEPGGSRTLWRRQAFPRGEAQGATGFAPRPARGFVVLAVTFAVSDARAPSPEPAARLGSRPSIAQSGGLEENRGVPDNTIPGTSLPLFIRSATGRGRRKQRTSYHRKGRRKPRAASGSRQEPHGDISRRKRLPTPHDSPPATPSLRRCPHRIRLSEIPIADLPVPRGGVQRSVQSSQPSRLPGGARLHRLLGEGPGISTIASQSPSIFDGVIACHLRSYKRSLLACDAQHWDAVSKLVLPPCSLSSSTIAENPLVNHVAALRSGPAVRISDSGQPAQWSSLGVYKRFLPAMELRGGSCRWSSRPGQSDLCIARVWRWPRLSGARPAR